MAAAVTVVTTLAWLAATAIPASAASTCTTATVDAGLDKVVLAIGADDKIVMAPGGGNWQFSINGGAMANCAGPGVVGTVQWIAVTGSDAGAETFTAYNPSVSWSAINTTIDLGNGSDSVTFQYAAMSAPVLADTGAGANFGLGTAANGSINGGSTIGGVADFRIDNGENITVNGSNALASPDAVSMSDLAQAGISVLVASLTADDTFATISPVAQNVTFNAGSGDDTFVSGNGADNFQGGPGADTVSYAFSSAGVSADLAAATGTGQGNDVLADVQNITGSAFNDTLTGNSLDNTIIGGAGADVIDAAAGNDTETGGTGDDTFNQGAAANGNDVIDGTVGDCFGGGDPTEIGGDWVNYGDRTGNTVVRFGAGPVSGADANADGDAADAGDERDTILATIENVTTGSGADTIVGSFANCEWMTPGAGADTVNGGGAVGGDGFDWDVLDESDQTGPSTMDISGLGSDAGPAGNATATLGTQIDTATHIEGYSGTEEDDTLIWNGLALMVPAGGGALHGDFSFRGYGGTDLVDASTATRGVTVDLGLLRPGATDDLENAIGGSGGDTVIGNTLNNKLQGNDGADSVQGLGGNDRIEGGLGNDLLDTTAGNTGADTLVYVNAASGEDIDNQLGFAKGGDGADSIGFFAIIKASDFNDTIRAGQNSFSLNQRLYGRGGNDEIVGSNSSDLLSGGDGDDGIRAGNGDDTLRGGAGDDFLVGGNGFDVGRGGVGDDSCRGIERRYSC
jgi:Ca2+-binding RTX toxin-like protein